jgi:antitoxin component YwqK of YwqJK toxin-antitoxin module
MRIQNKKLLILVLSTAMFFVQGLFAQQPANTIRDVARKHSNGNPYVVVYMKPNGEIVKEEVFYPNGKMEWEGCYKKSLEDGEWRYYYPNGKIKSKQYYVKGKENGVFSDFDEQGNVIKQSVYSSGKLISEKK